MKKLLIPAILLTLILVGCGSSVSTETREAAGSLIDGLTASLTNIMEVLKDSENAGAANAAAAGFKAEIDEYAEQDQKLKDETKDYFLINSDKNLLAQIDTLSQTISSFKRSLGGESEAYKLPAFAQPAAATALAGFNALTLYPIEWLNACADAKGLIESLTVLMDTTLVSMRDARDGSGSGAALVSYAESLRTLSARGVELENKYPDFQKAAADPSMERPISDLRAAMVALGKQIKDDSVKYEKKDADFDNSLARMQEIMDSLKR